MLLHMFIPLLACLGLATAREFSKVFKSLPAISSSLVNLGKMDVSFYFNSKTPDKDAPVSSKPEFGVHQPNSFFSKLDTIAEEPCPCMRASKNSPQTNPSNILNKLLMSNDLFSFNKNEPTTSMACCDSHERVQEETILFELGPKQSHMDLTQQMPSQQNNFPILPFIFDSIMQKQPLPGVMPMKPKGVEIFFFPKKKDNEAIKFFPNKKEFKKGEIQIVGDKELRNDFKTYKFRPSFPITSFAKKTFSPDVVEEIKPVKEVKFDETTEKTTQTTVSQPNIVVN